MRIEVYDLGEQFADRYTVVLTSLRQGMEFTDIYAMSQDANMPNGVCMYVDAKPEELNKGKPIAHDEVPHAVFHQIINMLDAEKEELRQELNERREHDGWDAI